MKKLFFSIVLMVTTPSFSQVGIGTTSPASSAALDVTSTTKGFVLPRMTYLQKTAIVSPAAGLMVWCTDCGSNGEFQVYNGSSWTNGIGVLGSVPPPPSAPLNPVATAINAQASVSFTTPVSDGGNPITSYTVTASPGGLTATGTSSPIVFSNLNGGVSYTFTVVATNAYGDSVASSATSSLTTNCGAYVAAGTWKQFMCHNLGADTSFDPNVPVQEIHGNYYQWGRSTIVADAYTLSAAISGWSTTNATDVAWSEAAKTANDPCPSGYRVPKLSQFSYINATTSTFNSVTKTGSWLNDATNFGSAVHFGISLGVKSLTFPACGYRSLGNGTLVARGSRGLYWISSYTISGSSNSFEINNTSPTSIGTNATRTLGFSIRCISE